MRSSSCLCMAFSLMVLASTASGQALVNYGAASAVGSTAGSVAGNTIGRSLDGTLRKTAAAAEKAAKEEPPAKRKTPEGALLHVSVAPAATAVGSVAGQRASNAAGSAHAPNALVVETPTVTAPVLEAAVVQAQAVRPSTEAVAALKSGMSREDLAAKMGAPTYKISIPEDGHLVEIYRYSADGKDLATVHLSDGLVTSVTPLNP